MRFRSIENFLFLISISSVILFSQNAELTKRREQNLESASVQKAEQESSQVVLLKSAPSFGFGNVIANWSFLQFLQYFGDEDARKGSGYDYSPDYLATVIEHDPYYRYFYLFLSESTTFYAGLPQKTVAIIEEGLSHLSENRSPDSFYIWRYKGSNELLFLDDSEAAQRSFEMAAKWAARSDHRDAEIVTQLSAQTAAFLSSDPDSRYAQISVWGNVLTTSFDDNTRARAITEIESLGGIVTISERGSVNIQYEQ